MREQRAARLVMVFLLGPLAWIGDAGGAPQDHALVVEQAVMARSVENRQPVGEATVFAPDVGQVACFTKITGADDETYIYHVWFHGETQRAEVRLPVRSTAWRTWSTKRIDPSWTGSWSVEVRDGNGTVLDMLRFTITEAAGVGDEDTPEER